MVSPVDNDPNSPLPFGFTEFKDSGDESYDWINGEYDSDRIFDGPWDNRHDFLNSLMWQHYEVDGHPVSFPPAFHPEIVGISAISAKVKGLLKTNRNTSTNYIKHDVARITVHYGSIKANGGGSPDNNGNNPFTEEKLDSSVELIPIKCQRLVYTGETTQNKEAPDDPVVGTYTDNNGVIHDLYPHYGDGQTYHDFEELKEETLNLKVIILNYKLSIPLVLAPRWSDITAALGCVNSIPFTTPSGLIAAKGTLLYGGISGITKRELLRGRLGWALEHSFQYKQKEWNKRPIGDFATEGTTETAVVKWIDIKPKLYDSFTLQSVYRGLTSEEEQLLREARNDGGLGN